MPARARAQAIAVAAGVAALAAGAAGCGERQPTVVSGPRVVQARDVARFPPGPQRAAMELLRALQYNAPGAAERWVTDNLGFDPARVSGGLGVLQPLALALHVPRSIRVERRGRDTALIPIRWHGERLALRWVRRGGDWRLDGFSDVTPETAAGVTYLLFSLAHPELHGRRLRAGETALKREYAALYERVLGSG